jgi:hypothetical protein
VGGDLVLIFRVVRNQRGEGNVLDCRDRNDYRWHGVSRHVVR